MLITIFLQKIIFIRIGKFRLFFLFDIYIPFFFKFISLFNFFFLSNKSQKNQESRSVPLLNPLLNSSFLSVSKLSPFRRISLESWIVFFFFCPIFKDSPFALAQCRKYLYTWRPDSCECEGIFPSQFSFLRTFVSSIFIRSCHGFKSYLKWTIFQPTSFSVPAYYPPSFQNPCAYIFHPA